MSADYMLSSKTRSLSRRGLFVAYLQVSWSSDEVCDVESSLCDYKSANVLALNDEFRCVSSI